MVRLDGVRRGLFALVFVVVSCTSTAFAAKPPGEVASSPNAQQKFGQQSSRFWQAVAAKPERRGALLEQYFSPGIRQRNGDQSLLESLSMLDDALGPDVASLAPAKIVGNDREGELQYTLNDGRRVLLKLTLTADDPPRIDRFAVRPLPPEVEAVKPDQLSAVIRRRINAAFEAGQFSGAVLVARGEDVIHAQAVGLADRKTRREITPDTPINLGSINKMFTAIAIAQLQAAGKLDWQDTVGRHLPSFPNARIRDHVTIHQLLTHTSGVGSYWNDAHTARRSTLASQQAFLETFVDQPLLFEPGKGTEYSNGGPVILGLIIEALSGTDYYSYIRKNIYQPAGMKNADHFRRDDTRAGIAQGYFKTAAGEWKDNSDDLSLRGSAAGGGYASARDLHAFARALGEGRILSRAQLENLWNVRIQTGPVGYGYLFSVGNTSGKRWVGHNGGAPGISAEFIYYPNDGLAIIVLANQDHAATPMREWLHALLDASLLAGR